MRPAEFRRLDVPCRDPGPVRRGPTARAVALPRRPDRDRGTGMEPFVTASALGLCLWAILLAPFLL